MVALKRHGIECAALVHRHTLSLRTRSGFFNENGSAFKVVKAGLWARALFTPISPSFPWHLHLLLKSYGPDILHLHLPNPSAFWVLALPSARRIPWVVHWHSDVVTSAQGWKMRFFYRLYRPLEQTLLKHAHTVVATSAPYLEASEPLRKWLTKCQVVPLSIDVDRLENVAKKSATGKPRQWKKTEPGNPQSSLLRVLAVGRQTYYKGFRYLIEAAARVAGVHIILVGDGDQAVELRELARTLGVCDKVSFRGVLSDVKLVEEIQACDCLCLPSIERSEAFGLVLLEAMYFGKATVISDVPGSGMGWIVDQDVTGLKVEPADADALATAFEALTADRDKLVEMGQNGKCKFDRVFAISNAIEPMINMYEKILHLTITSREQ